MSTFALIALTALGVAVLLFLVIVVRLQAFVALLIVSLLVAVLGGIPPSDIADVIQTGMGETLGFIAIVVGLGAMFGEMLQQSGGARTISHTLIRTFGEENAPWALGLTGLIVSIPVFLDVALILFIPLVYSLARRSGRSLLYYAIPLLAGMAVAHSFIPPTPGPVAVASLLNADLGWVIVFGLVAGMPATILGGVFFGRYIAGQVHLGVPEHMLPDDTEQAPEPSAPESSEDGPSFALVVALIAVPLLLILMGTASEVLLAEENAFRRWITFLGHPFTALTLAALLAFYLLGTRLGYTADEIQKMSTASLEPAGLVILITGAGGVFGEVLVETGVGEALADVMAASSLPGLLLAFLIAAAVRVSQGSATVSMVTAASLMAPVLEASTYSGPQLGLYTVAIASGATILSHVNDSGFWLVSRFLGMSEEETLRSWTVMETIVGLVGLAVVLGVSLFI